MDLNNELSTIRVGDGHGDVLRWTHEAISELVMAVQISWPSMKRNSWLKTSTGISKRPTSPGVQSESRYWYGSGTRTPRLPNPPVENLETKMRLLRAYYLNDKRSPALPVAITREE